MITHYDLFAGIGGFSYALDTVFHDQEIKHIFCEWEAFPTAVLKKHWPDSTYYGDIADLVADTERERLERSRCNSKRHTGLSHRKGANKDEGLTILTGGFPCQPFSHAGRRKGTADNRYKWPEMFAVIRNVQPDWIIAENVRGLASWNDGMVLETVCSDLEGEGYEVQPFIVPAASVGAPHKRDRVWIVGVLPKNPASQRRGRWSHGNSQRNDGEIQVQGFCSRGWAKDWREVAFATCHDGVDDGISQWVDEVGTDKREHRSRKRAASALRKARLHTCGNAIVPQVAMQFFAAIRESKVL